MMVMMIVFMMMMMMMMMIMIIIMIGGWGRLDWIIYFIEERLVMRRGVGGIPNRLFVATVISLS